jgi:branched-chain amino acid transport system ATP-binding protein
MSVLSIQALEVRHGLLRAVREVSLEIAEGETLALVGANGAGKTSLLRALAGANPVFSGRVVFDGRDITDVPAHQRVRSGVALVPEGRRLFADLTVRENLMLAQDLGRSGRWTIESVIEAFPLLGELVDQRAGNLSGGEQQATAIGRGLITNPRLLMLDEVSLGLAPVAIKDVYDSLRHVIEDGATTIILVEQDLGRALQMSDQVACMLEGQVVLSGSTGDVSHEAVVEAYFGLQRAGATGA